MLLVLVVGKKEGLNHAMRRMGGPGWRIEWAGVVVCPHCWTAVDESPDPGDWEAYLREERPHTFIPADPAKLRSAALKMIEENALRVERVSWTRYEATRDEDRFFWRTYDDHGEELGKHRVFRFPEGDPWMEAACLFRKVWEDVHFRFASRYEQSSPWRDPLPPPRKKPLGRMDEDQGGVHPADAAEAMYWYGLSGDDRWEDYRTPECEEEDG